MGLDYQELHAFKNLSEKALRGTPVYITQTCTHRDCLPQYSLKTPFLFIDMFIAMLNAQRNERKEKYPKFV